MVIVRKAITSLGRGAWQFCSCSSDPTQHPKQPRQVTQVRRRRAKTYAMEKPEKYLLTCGGRIFCVRCTAMSKNTREQCRKPALKISRTQKCQFHGGRSTGPKTAEGKARIGAAHLVHGGETKLVRLERSQGSLRMSQLEDVAHAIGLITATRTTGRKPAGYRPIRTLEEARAWVLEDALQQIKAAPEAE